MIPHLCLCFLQSCNKSLINQACSGPYWENIGLRSFLYCARSVLSRPLADILPVWPSRLVNKIYLFTKCEGRSEKFWPRLWQYGQQRRQFKQLLVQCIWQSGQPYLLLSAFKTTKMHGLVWFPWKQSVWQHSDQ